VKKKSFVVQDHSTRNKVFDLSDPVLNRDNCHYQFYLLKQYFASRGYDLSTQDINGPENSDAVLFRNVPSFAAAMPPSLAGKSFLLFLESKAIRPENYLRANHAGFRRIFTNADEFVDGQRYLRVNYCDPFPDSILDDVAPRSGFAALVAANKRTLHPDSLSGERRRLIDWFDRAHPGELDLFGPDWDLYKFAGPRWVRKLNRRKILRPLRRALAATPRCYRGTVVSKLDTLRGYRFCIAFENIGGVPGYITEKLFDAFKAGCIPVYLGAPNIGDYVPGDCFIDASRFSNFEELYSLMRSIGDAEYYEYLQRIDAFLKSEACRQFTPEHFAETVSEGLIDALEGHRW